MKTEIILDIIIIATIFLSPIIKSYLQEKGKNIATSEDIEELTQKVETIKEDFNNKSAILKAKLDLLTNLELNFKNEKRNSLINFHKDFAYWFDLLSTSSPSLVDEYNNKEIDEKIYKYDLVYQKVLTSEALVQLYFEDKHLNQLIYNLKVAIIKYLTPHSTNVLLNLKYNNFEFEQYNKIPAITIEEIEKKKIEHENLIKKRSAIYNEYREKMIDSYQKVMPLYNEYLLYVRKIINNIN